MSQQKEINIVLTGAAGNIAYSLVPIIGSGIIKNKGMVFGQNIFINFYLYDLEEKINKLKAFALEIEDCCF